MWYNDFTKNAMEGARNGVSKRTKLSYDKNKLKNKWDWMREHLESIERKRNRIRLGS